MKKLIWCWWLLLLMVSCSQRAAIEDFNLKIYTPEYASGFDILGAEGWKSTIIRVFNPWQGAENTQTLLFVSRDGEKAPRGFEGQTVEAGAENIICLSSTHVAMFDALGEVGRVRGVSGIDYISNEYVRKNAERIADIGYDRNIDYEKIVAQRADVVLLFGISGASPMESKLAELGIPYLYVGEYLEESPIGKSEWVVAVAEMLDKREEGITCFRAIPERYNSLKAKVKACASPRPRVMVNTPFGGQWFMPSTESYVARLIADAGGDFVYQKNTSNRSVPIDIEEAYLLASEADVWVNVGTLTTQKEFDMQFPKFTGLRCCREGKIYNSSKRISASGSNDYWESGVMHPDVVLSDLVEIFHPEVQDIGEEEMYYYCRLK